MVLFVGRIRLHNAVSRSLLYTWWRQNQTNNFKDLDSVETDSNKWSSHCYEDLSEHDQYLKKTFLYCILQVSLYYCLYCLRLTGVLLLFPSELLCYLWISPKGEHKGTSYCILYYLILSFFMIAIIQFTCKPIHSQHIFEDKVVKGSVWRISGDLLADI